MLDQLTIVIPTYKRYPFLKRLLKFYNSYNISTNFLILDSTPYEPEDKELIIFLNQKNIEWLKYKENIFFSSKLAEGCNKIKTKYAVLNADDDFIIPSSLSKCISFLNLNHDYSSAYGRFYRHLNYQDLINKKFSIGLLHKSIDNVLHDLPSDRLSSYSLGKTTPPFYSVQKTEIFKLAWKEAGKHTSKWGLGEILPSVLTLIYGKVKLLPIFYISRESNNFQFVDKSMFKDWYSPFRVEKAIKCLTKHLVKVEGLNDSRAHLFIKGLLNKEINKTLSEDFSVESKSSLSVYVKKTILFLRNKIGIRTRIRELLFYGCPSSIYFSQKNDFFNIKKSVIDAKLTFDELNLSRKDYQIE